MIDRILHTIENDHLLCPDDPVIAAVSGGADSLCLLEVLHRLHYRVTAVHVQHHLRESAERDAAFTEAFANERGIPFIRRDVDVRKRVEETGESVEEAARFLRYAALEEEREKLSAETGREAVVALAHHRNDQAETVLFHLIRGSGLTGLSGMRPERGHFIRPLLYLSRAEIEAWMAAEGLSFCHDETNDAPDPARNRIRQEVLPALERIRPDAAAKIAETADVMAETDAYLMKCAGERLENAGAQLDGAGAEIPETLAGEDPVLMRAIIRYAMKKQGLPLKDVTRGHFEEIRLLFEKPVGKTVCLPAGVSAVRTYGGVRIGTAAADGETEMKPAEIHCRTFPYEKGVKIPEKECTKWFDYDKIKGNVSLRTRRPGDFISTREGTRKKLSDWMIDEKIPKELRDRIPVAADEEEVLWVPGYRRGESKKITDETKTVLEITAR